MLDKDIYTLMTKVAESGQNELINDIIRVNENIRLIRSAERVAFHQHDYTSYKKLVKMRSELINELERNINYGEKRTCN